MSHLNGSAPLGLVSSENSRDTEGVHLITTSDGEVVNPQPADDPADPLNWPLSLKASACSTASRMAANCFASSDRHSNPSQCTRGPAWTQCRIHQSSADTNIK